MWWGIRDASYATHNKSLLLRMECFEDFKNDQTPKLEDKGVGLGVEDGEEIGDEGVGRRSARELVGDEIHERGLLFAQEFCGFLCDPFSHGAVDLG